MTHAELSEKFLEYHQKTWPDRVCFPNRTGVAVYGTGKEKRVVPYGIPPPLLGKKKKAGGGGPDFFSYGNEDGYFTVWFFEVKRIGDRMRLNQIRFANFVIGRGGKYWIVKEQPGDSFKLVRYEGQ